MLTAKVCPDGCKQFTDTLEASSIVCKAAFSGPGFVLTDATIYVLRSMGYDTSVKDTDMASPAQAAMCLTYQYPQFADHSTRVYCV